MDRRIEAILPKVSKPARYINHELNSVHKDWDSVKVKMALAFPDVYEVGMGHLGFKILYHIINKRQDALAERVYAPWVDMEDEMGTHDIPLWALESGQPLKSFDIIGFTLQYELSYSNIVNMLDLASIPRFSADRTKDHPFIIAGGPCSFNVEPIADFLDFVVLGEGEEVIHEVLDILANRKPEDSRHQTLLRLQEVSGIYVPSFYEPEYNQDGTVKGIVPKLPNIPEVIRKRIVADLSTAEFPESFVVPYIDVVHDRAMVEVLRGCTRGCRFCQAGMIYRPVRERSPEVLKEQVRSIVKNTGYDEVSLTSLSSGDYSCIEGIVTELTDEYGDQGVALSLPSLRIDSFSVNLATEIQKSRKTGLTFAPEAGTQRLRDVINKNVSEEDLYKTVEGAFSAGWHQVKLYFMIGLPTETFEDLDGIVQLARNVLNIGRKHRPKKGKKASVTVSVSSFVPKPHTPFQWEAQDTQEVLVEKQQYLRERLRQPGISYQYHDVRTSFLEGVFSRGDRKLAKVLASAVDRGCRFDGWSEQFKYGLWMESFQDLGIDPYWYANRERGEQETLPWEHLQPGIGKQYLLKERNASLMEGKTEDCRFAACSLCGVCPDFSVKNLLHKGGDNAN